MFKKTRILHADISPDRAKRFARPTRVSFFEVKYFLFSAEPQNVARVMCPRQRFERVTNKSILLVHAASQHRENKSSRNIRTSADRMMTTTTYS